MDRRRVQVVVAVVLVAAVLAYGLATGRLAEWLSGVGTPPTASAPPAGARAPRPTTRPGGGYAPRSAAPSDAIPGGGLRAHEGAGHTIERHVGKSDADLARRARDESKREVSAFDDLETADRAVGEALYAKRDAVARWLAGDPEGNQDFEARLSTPVGRVWRSDTRRASPGRTVVVVLRPSGRFPEGFVVTTAYVTLP